MRVWRIVVNLNKPEKLRVVFDCAAQCNGVSLNDRVLQGPDLTNNLMGVLLRFRELEVAVMADVDTDNPKLPDLPSMISNYCFDDIN